MKKEWKNKNQVAVGWLEFGLEEADIFLREGEEANDLFRYMTAWIGF